MHSRRVSSARLHNPSFPLIPGSCDTSCIQQPPPLFSDSDLFWIPASTCLHSIPTHTWQILISSSLLWQNVFPKEGNRISTIPYAPLECDTDTPMEIQGPCSLALELGRPLCPPPQAIDSRNEPSDSRAGHKMPRPFTLSESLSWSPGPQAGRD